MRNPLFGFVVGALALFVSLAPKSAAQTLGDSLGSLAGRAAPAQPGPAAGQIGMTAIGTVAGEPTPPLRPGEFLVPLANCAVVFNTSDFSNSTPDAVRAGFSAISWTGECRNSLAFGDGNINERYEVQRGQVQGVWTRRMAWGRTLSRREVPGYTFDGGRTRFVYKTRDGGVAAHVRNAPDAYDAFWFTEGAPVRLVSSVQGPAGHVFNVTQPCTEGVRGCNTRNPFTAYGVMLLRDGRETATWCPNPRTPQGCERVWQTVAAPVIESVRAVISQAETEDAALLAELEALNSGWDAGYPAMVAQVQQQRRAQLTMQVNQGVSAINAVLARMGRVR